MNESKDHSFEIFAEREFSFSKNPYVVDISWADLKQSDQTFDYEKGSFGELYRVIYGGDEAVSKYPRIRDESTSREILEAFANERDHLFRLQHPRILRFFGEGFDPEKKLPFIVMEYVEQVLSRLIRHGHIDYKNHREKIVQNVATGLEYLKTRGVVHNDIKPHNILIRNDFKAVIADFGSAQDATVQPWIARGSPPYMPPEVLHLFKGELSVKIDPWKIDVFALGAVVAKMFICISFPEHVSSRRHANCYVEYLSECKEESYENLQKLLAKTLSDDPANRPTIEIFSRDFKMAFRDDENLGTLEEGFDRDGTISLKTLRDLLFSKDNQSQKRSRLWTALLRFLLIDEDNDDTRVPRATIYRLMKFLQLKMPSRMSGGQAVRFWQRIEMCFEDCWAGYKKGDEVDTILQQPSCPVGSYCIRISSSVSKLRIHYKTEDGKIMKEYVSVQQDGFIGEFGDKGIEPTLKAVFKSRKYLKVPCRMSDSWTQLPAKQEDYL
eukprot:TRINITY_DN2159_c0_g2_i1.p1 TRINITY_DN2159_c0_g2~~TRINITY_DN2159_c0_g2_i1.p1  ORF type:complete len:504 (+),score=65.16 TRINITY_DN2159_c0_g2_i1:25-1512(+)